MRKKSELPQPKVGALLISEPFNPEPNFKRSVVLVSQHSQRGTIGFIVNKPTPLSINEALDDFPEFDAPVFWGGPIKLDSIYYVHMIPSLKGAKKIVPGLYWGGDYEQLKTMVESGAVEPDQIKFLAGFAAWVPDQLEEEILSDNWWVTEADVHNALLEEPTVVWGKVLRGMGHVYGILNDFPEDPHQN